LDGCETECHLQGVVSPQNTMVDTQRTWQLEAPEALDIDTLSRKRNEFL